MAVTSVELESLTTKSRFVTLAQKANDGTFIISGADSPLVTIDINHQRNHDGRAFFAYKVYPDSAKLASGASINIAMAAPAGVFVHVTVEGLCLGDAELFIYEGSTTSGGTPFTPINRNRNHTITNPSQVAMVIAPTVSAVGTEIDAQIIPGGSGNKSTGGSAQSLEYVLKPLTTYLFRLTNVNGTAHAAYLTLEWYE